MKILVFGGTFDPVHAEHVKIASGAMKELQADKLIIIPSFIPPHKAMASAGAESRLEMARLAFGPEGGEVSDMEVARGGNSYTYMTAETLEKQYPSAERYFLIGGDSFMHFESWVKPDVIAEKFKIVVVSRGERTAELKARAEEFKKLHGYRPKILGLCGRDLSSTYIRYALMLKIRPEGLKNEVYDYIVRNKLYTGGKIFDYVAGAIKASRRKHTAGVIEAALEMNKQLGLDESKVVAASVLHDVAKYNTREDFPEAVIPDDVPENVVHAFLGEYVAREKLGIKDEDVLMAIRYHTTGRAAMTPLEKLVYTADLVERSRNYEGAAELRRLCFADFDAGFAECMRQGYKHLKQTLRGGVYYLTEEAYEYYKNQQRG